MSTRLPVLIFAQSGRFIAEAASSAGYPVWVADCYGDSDTRRHSQRFALLPAIETLALTEFLAILADLSQGEACYLVCGTGIEQIYPFLAALPPHIHLLGNAVSTLTQTRQADRFFPLLQELQLPYPERFSSPAPDRLKKNLLSAGGTGINQPQTHADDFYQQTMAGKAMSVLFVANRQRAVILSCQQQDCETGSFRLQHLKSPYLLTSTQQQFVQHSLDKLTAATGLCGVNSLDFICDANGELFILEVNPRISASAELLPASFPLFQSHLDACLRRELPTPPPLSQQVTQRSYCFSSNQVTIPTEMSWPAECHDLPLANTVIPTGAPICTIIVQATSWQGCQRRYADIIKQLQTTLKNSA